MNKFYPELERGMSAQLTNRKHIPNHIFKSAKSLQKMQGQIEDLLNNTNILNSGKNTQKALKLLEQWIPQVKTFETNIRLLEKSLTQAEK